MVERTAANPTQAWHNALSVYRRPYLAIDRVLLGQEEGAIQVSRGGETVELKVYGYMEIGRASCRERV